MTTIHIPTGRALVRQTSEGFITVGVMHFDDGFAPEDGVAYPLVFDQLGTSVSGEQLDNANGPGYPIDLLTDWATQPRWRSSNPELSPTMQVNSVRFVQAFDNGYTFLSVSKQDPFKASPHVQAPDHSHYFVGIEQGQLRPFETPLTGHKGAGLNGMALQSLLNDLCVWPDAQGTNHTLPVLTKVARLKFDKLRDIDRQLIMGTIDPEVAAKTRREMGEMGTSDVLKDDNWRSYFKLACEYGMASSFGEAQTHQHHAKREAFATSAIKGIMSGDTDSPELHAQLQKLSGNHRIPLEPYTVTLEQDSIRPASAPEPF